MRLRCRPLGCFLAVAMALVTVLAGWSVPATMAFAAASPVADRFHPAHFDVAPAERAGMAGLQVAPADDAHGCCDPSPARCPAACALLCLALPAVIDPAAPVPLFGTDWTGWPLRLESGRVIDVDDPPPRA